MLVKNARIWTNDGQWFNEGYVTLSDGEIERVGPMAEAPAQPGEAFDAAGRLLLPGLVNAHTHLYSALARGMALGGVEPYSFHDILAQIWWRLDKALDGEANYHSALVGGAELLRCGVTTLVDHHASPSAIRGSLGQLKRAVVDELGLRACLCYEVTDRDGAAPADQGIAENVAFWDEVQAAKTGRVGALVGLHASFTVSDRTVERLQAALDGRQAGFHIHVAEGQEDGVDAAIRYRKRPVHRLRDLGLLGPNSILAHCIHLSEPEKDLLAEHDAIVANQPQSNMNNAVGAADLPGLLRRGVLVGLGNDGFGSNLLDDLKAAYLVQKHHAGDPKTLDMAQAHRLLFENNYEIARRLLGVRLGKIAPGYQADFILVDYDPPTPLSEDNWMGHLIFGLCSRFDVTHAFVGGRMVLTDREVAGVDLARAYARSRECAEALWGRIV